MKIYVRSYEWAIDLTKDEIENFLEVEAKIVSDDFIEFSVNSDKELLEFTYTLLYYCRTIENVYLEIDSDNKLFSMPKVEIQVGVKKKQVFDLIGFNLSERDFRINSNTDSINPIIINCCFYLLGLDEEDKINVIDPSANFGEVILEAALFNPRKPVNIKKRHELNIYRVLKYKQDIPKSIIDKGKYTAIVQTDKEFSKLKENLNHSGQKVKISKFEFDWLDVKFKEDQFDFVISSFPLFTDDAIKEQFVDQFFYQAAFIAKNAICVISREKIDDKYLEKHELDVEDLEELELNNIKYYIYVIS